MSAPFCLAAYTGRSCSSASASTPVPNTFPSPLTRFVTLRNGVGKSSNDSISGYASVYRLSNKPISCPWLNPLGNATLCFSNPTPAGSDAPSDLPGAETIDRETAASPPAASPTAPLSRSSASPPATAPSLQTRPPTPPCWSPLQNRSQSDALQTIRALRYATSRNLKSNEISRMAQLYWNTIWRAVPCESSSFSSCSL